MPLVYFGTGWFIRIALAPALHLPIEVLLLALLIPIVGRALWWDNHRVRSRAQCSFTLRAPPEFATFNYADYLARQGVYSLIDRPQVKVLGHDQGNAVLAAIFAFRERAYVVLSRFCRNRQLHY